MVDLGHDLVLFFHFLDVLHADGLPAFAWLADSIAAFCGDDHFFVRHRAGPRSGRSFELVDGAEVPSTGSTAGRREEGVVFQWRGLHRVFGDVRDR